MYNYVIDVVFLRKFDSLRIFYVKLKFLFVNRKIMGGLGHRNSTTDHLLRTFLKMLKMVLCQKVK